MTIAFVCAVFIYKMKQANDQGKIVCSEESNTCLLRKNSSFEEWIFYDQVHAEI